MVGTLYEWYVRREPKNSVQVVVVRYKESNRLILKDVFRA